MANKPEQSEVPAPVSNGATVAYNAAVDRWFVHDWSGKPVAMRRTREEADAFAASLLPRPPDRRQRPEPPTINGLSPTPKETRPGFFDRQHPPRVVLKAPRRAR